MENEISLKYQLSESELMDAIRAQSMRTWSFRFLVVFILILFIYLGVQQLVYGTTLDWFLFTLAPIVIVSGVLAFFTYSNPLVRRRIRQEPKYTSEQAWQFSESGVQSKTAFGESKREWQVYPKVAEDAKYFILFLPSNAYTPIPKRAFASADELIRFRALLKRKVARWG
jgi:hypothetical protein